MKIAVLTQFYPPEPCAASNRASALARYLASRGHAVEVITGFPNFPDGIIPERYRGKRSVRERDGDVTVTRLWTYASPNRSPLRRVGTWLSLAFAMLPYVVFRLGECDAVYVSSPPITLSLPAIVAKMVRHARLIADIRDAYPEVTVNLGILKRDGLPARLIGMVADTLYRSADAITVATEGIYDALVQRGVPESKLLLATNGFDRVDTSARAPFERSNGETIVTFVGNMGLVSGLDVLLDAAGLLNDRPEIRWVLVGAGNDYARVRERARSLGLRNVTFTGVVSREVAMAAVRDCDATVVPLRKSIVDCLPTKMIDALALGCPVVLSGGGEAQRMLESSGAGWCVPAEDAAALAGAVLHVAENPDERKSRAEAGLAVAREHYDRARTLERVARCCFDSA